MEMVRKMKKKKKRLSKAFNSLSKGSNNEQQGVGYVKSEITQRKMTLKRDVGQC